MRACTQRLYDPEATQQRAGIDVCMCLFFFQAYAASNILNAVDRVDRSHQVYVLSLVQLPMSWERLRLPHLHL